MPCDLGGGGVEEESGSGGLGALPEELGEAVVAFGDAGYAVAFDGVLGLLLVGEGVDGGAGGVGGVEAFYVADGFCGGFLGEVQGF